MATTVAVPPRAKVKAADTWDLGPLYKSDAAWEADFDKWTKMSEKFRKFRGTLGKSAEKIRKCFDFEVEFEKLGERLGSYAFLKASEDIANSDYQRMTARYTHVATRAGEAASYINPEIQAIPTDTLKKYIASPVLQPYRFQLEKLLRYKPHVLSEKEERLLAMQGQVSGGPSRIFGQLTDADLTYGTVTDEKGRKIELTQSSMRVLLESPRRATRRDAFRKFYRVMEGHKNTLAATLNTSVQQDVYVARARNFPSAREAALFADNVPVTVYDSLIEAVHANLDTVYKYLRLRRRALKVKELHVYDTYVPIVEGARKKTPYTKGVEMIDAALEPLGSEYRRTLKNGLLGRWVDRYENKGKRSGAFSAGGYTGPPYILMNYKEQMLDSVFTLAHEAGHSMHTWYATRTQPFQDYHYTIFVAEVASTFNEQLLGTYLLDRAKSKVERAALINKQIDEIRGTIIRQTMFAEFEKIIHEIAESGEALTIERFRAEYRKLLELYFGDAMVIDDGLELEGLRIPHFYRAFYVYKYATGLSAAIALSQMVMDGGKTERDRYINFLKSGGSKFPLDQLRDAGVDLEKPDTVNAAMGKFRELVDELAELV